MGIISHWTKQSNNAALVDLDKLEGLIKTAIPKAKKVKQTGKRVAFKLGKLTYSIDNEMLINVKLPKNATVYIKGPQLEHVRSLLFGHAKTE